MLKTKKKKFGHVSNTFLDVSDTAVAQKSPAPIFYSQPKPKTQAHRSSAFTHTQNPISSPLSFLHLIASHCLSKSAFTLIPRTQSSLASHLGSLPLEIASLCLWCCSNFRVPLPLRASHFRVPLPHGQLPFSRRPSVFTASSVSFSRPSASFSRPASLCLIYPSTLLHSHAGKLSFQIVQGKMYKNKKQVGKHGVTKGHVDTQDQDMDIRKIMKDVENFGYSHMSWKERKKIEDSKLVSLGGKPPKKQRLTLSVARPMMKKQKEREQKMLQERLILGQYGGKFGGRSKRSVEQQHKPEDRGLKSSEGRFRNGVLDVKHLLNSAPSRGHDSTETHVFRTGKKKGNKMKRGKKGAGKKRH